MRFFGRKLSEREIRDKRREKLLKLVDKLEYKGVECSWEDLEEAHGGSRTRRITRIVLVD